MTKFYGGGLSLLFGLGVMAYMWNMMLSQPTTEQFGLAFGNVKDGTIELHMVVGMLQAKTEQPSSWIMRDGNVATQDRDEYIAEHFLLKDSYGDPVLDENGEPQQWLYRTRSPFIPEQKVPLAEYYLVARLECGREYNLDFKPFRDEPVVFRHNFVAPQAEEKFWRLEFVETELEG